MSNYRRLVTSVEVKEILAAYKGPLNDLKLFPVVRSQVVYDRVVATCAAIDPKSVVAQFGVKLLGDAPARRQDRNATHFELA